MATLNGYLDVGGHFWYVRGVNPVYSQTVTPALQHITKKYGTPDFWLNIGQKPPMETTDCLDILGQNEHGLHCLPRIAAAKYYADNWCPAKYSELNFMFYASGEPSNGFTEYCPLSASYAKLKRLTKTCSAVYTDLTIRHPFVAYLVQWGLLILHPEPWPNLSTDPACTNNPEERWHQLRVNRELWDEVQSLQRGYVRAMLGMTPMVLPFDFKSLRGHSANGLNQLLRTGFSLGGE